MKDGRPVGEDDLQAYLDGRLGPERLSALEAYLGENPAAAATVALQAGQRQALRARLAFKAEEPIPARLRIANLMAAPRPSRFRAAAAAAWLALGLGLGAMGGAWLADGPLPGRVLRTSVADDAITAHRTYVGERLHPVEVAADQEAHLVQWLSRRVGRPLMAPDLTRLGYRLMGGRLLPAGSEPAALFMYDDSNSRLTLYARSGGPHEATAFRFEAQDGVSAFSWTDRGLSYVVTGSIGRDKLLAVAEAIHGQLEARPAPAGGSL